jgi:5-methylcytosine-specific restriction endonuclease McrA
MALRISDDWPDFSRYSEIHLCSNLEIDHVIARRLGGKTRLSNLQLLCIPCHKQKTSYERLLWPQRAHKRLPTRLFA